MNPLEKHLRSWTPRRPSDKIARRLFAKTGSGLFLGPGAELWRWLTPVAACVLTLLVTVQSSNRHLARLNEPDRAACFATFMFRGSSSNLQQTFVLSKADENVEWNVWPYPLPDQMRAAARPSSGTNFRDLIPPTR